MKKMKKRNGSRGRRSSPESRLGRPDVQSRLSARDRRGWGQTPTEGRGSVPDDSLTGRAVHIQGACPSLAGLVEGQEILNKRARKSGGRSAGVEQDTVIAAGPRACILTWRAERGNCSLPCIHHPLRPLFALHISGGLSGGERSDAASPILESRLESKNIALPVTERGLDGGLGGPGRGRTPTSLVSVSWQLMDTRCTCPSRKKSKPPDSSGNDLRLQGSAAPNLPRRREQQSAIDFHPAIKPQQSSGDEPTLPFQVPDGGKATNTFNRPQTYCCPNRDAAALTNTNVLSVRQAAGFPSAR